MFVEFFVAKTVHSVVIRNICIIHICLFLQQSKRLKLCTPISKTKIGINT